MKRSQSFRCPECENIYQIITESEDKIVYCPFCGEFVDPGFDKQDDYEEDDPEVFDDESNGGW